MKRRRGNGEGAVYQRADAQWCASVTAGYDPNGKRRRKTIYGATKDVLLQKLAKLQRDVVGGTLVDSERTTVAQHLKHWLEDSARPAIRPATYRSYKGLIENHINPHIGGVPLVKLSPLHVQGLYSTMERNGCSGRLRQMVHAVLHNALGRALKWNLVVRNVCEAVESPKAAKKMMQVWNPQEAGTFLATAADDRLYALYVLAIATGLRQGELLGLDWTDIDLNEAMLSVRRQLSEDAGVLEFTEPKTDKGRRRVDLPAFAVAALREHRKRMMVEGHPAPLVFCDTDGNPIRKSNLLRRSFFPLLKEAKVPRIRFHDLRHTAATLLLTQGVHPKIVQERLGHSQISLTMDTYSHVLPSMQKDAAAKLDGMFTKLQKRERKQVASGTS
jgi:integrase